ncbi:unnamed protein product, partial [Ilex paraguariensis]
MAMVAPKQLVSLCSLLLLFLFLVGAMARVVQKNDVAESRTVEKVQLQSSTDSTMAERLEEVEPALNEHAVDDPEEVAAMVN